MPPKQSVPLPPVPGAAEVLEQGRRLDGRGHEAFRPVFLQTKVNSQAAGSAYAEFANTKVMVAVYGPRQSDRKQGFTESGRINCEVTFTSFASSETNSRARQVAEKLLSKDLQQALSASALLDSFPKAVVDVYALIVEAGGSELAVAVTAASLALADAGIELYDLVPACTVSLVGHNDLLLDASAHEQHRQVGGLMLSMMPARDEVTHLNMVGDWEPAQTKEALDLAVGGCAQLKKLMRKTLLEAAEA